MSENTNKAEGFKFFKLGPTAASFVCAKTGFAIANNAVGKVKESSIANSEYIREAARHGHLIEATEEEYTAYLVNAGKELPEEKEKGNSAGSGAATGGSTGTAGAEADDDDDDDDDDDAALEKALKDAADKKGKPLTKAEEEKVKASLKK